MVKAKENDLVKYEFTSQALKGFSGRSITITKLCLLVFTATFTGGIFLENTIPGLLPPAQAQKQGLLRAVQQGQRVATVAVRTGVVPTGINLSRMPWRRVTTQFRNLAFLCEHINYGAYVPRIHIDRKIYRLDNYIITGANGSKSLPFNIPPGIYFFDFVENGTNNVVDRIRLEVR